MRFIVLFFVFVLGVLSGPSWADPCSGSMGGVARCEGEKFVCVDGRVSWTKKNCQESVYAKNASSVVDRVPEKSGYTIISWVVGVLAVLVVVLGLVVWYAARWAWRYFNKDQAKAKA